MPLSVNAYLTRGHIAIITKTESTYVMIESTLRFDGAEVIPGLLPLLQVIQRSRTRSRERSGNGLGTRLAMPSVYYSMHNDIVRVRAYKAGNKAEPGWIL